MAKYEGMRDIRKYGGSTVIIIDSAIKNLLGVDAGDYVYVTIQKSKKE